MKVRFVTLVILIVIFLVTGCSGTSQSQPDQNGSTQPYPIDLESTGYPVSDYYIEPESGYPIRDIDPEFPQGPKFTINSPVSHLDQFVRGTGPVGVPIKLVNVSEVGLVLSETVIQSDGTFEFVIVEPLVSGHMIGIQLGDISGTNFNEEDFLYSDTYYERPFVGLMFDMVTVE
jgi:hypothetical protein